MSIKPPINCMIGFSSNNETLPYGFGEFTNDIKLRQVFLGLIEPMIKDNIKFTKYEILKLSKYSLKDIFTKKIKQNLPISYIKPYVKAKSFKFNYKSTLIINNYILKENKNIIFSSNDLLGIAKIISLCFINNKLQLHFDANYLFHQFVYKRICSKNHDKFVIDSGDSISILGANCEPLKIYTSWKDVSLDNLNIKKELTNAIESIKQSEFKKIYLIFPKAKEFKKHIPIKVTELKDNSYDIKIVPYSLRSTIRKLIKD